MAAPFYDFNDALMKPWHLKATYQLYDQSGNPTEQGTCEYWWASPKVYRSTWTRPSATYSDWHTTDGNHSILATGESLKYFEKHLQQSMLSPIPYPFLRDSASMQLDYRERSRNGTKFPCISMTRVNQGEANVTLPNLAPLYCFDQRLPVLRATIDDSVIVNEFNNIAKIQGKFLAREILAFVEQHKMFAVQVESVDSMGASDSALIPDARATLVKTERADMTHLGSVAAGPPAKTQLPVYPELAMRIHQNGKVILGGTIGVDGKVHDLDIIYGSSKSFADAALEAVSHWEYKPCLVNGEPIEVETTINVVFIPGR
ncbi:MAG: energy transducer TonB [Terracidiphilus sp.]